MSSVFRGEAHSVAAISVLLEMPRARQQRSIYRAYAVLLNEETVRPLTDPQSLPHQKTAQEDGRLS